VSEVKQVLKITSKLRGITVWSSFIDQINVVLNDYKDRNGELVAVTTTTHYTHTIIQFDA